ncbi:hypothetical protein AVEN_234640-1 [Araneus ventricosus]|uniref:Uncharacterized protein n=1 Tax=Araneus ventricosus TaxID=182803 RepID=A0A4Y2D1E9_ARAVE|nr:hypothetical protein AVEN_234640-1 [Araneus ventricosus]
MFRGGVDDDDVISNRFHNDVIAGAHQPHLHWLLEDSLGVLLPPAILHLSDMLRVVDIQLHPRTVRWAQNNSREHPLRFEEVTALFSPCSTLSPLSHRFSDESAGGSTSPLASANFSITFASRHHLRRNYRNLFLTPRKGRNSRCL